MTATPSPARRAYLVGTVFSGSTVFGQALGSADGVRYLGEVDRLVQFPATMWADEPEATCHYCELHNQDCPVWTGERVAQARTQPYGRLMDHFEETFGPDILIDGSKHPQWLRTVGFHGGIDPARTVAYLTVRSPFAFVDSYRARTRAQAWEAANVWRDVNYDAMRLLARQRLPVMTVRYEDFARDPEEVLRPACALLGIDYTPDLRLFQQQPSHDVGGNYNARAVADSSATFDPNDMKRKIPEHWVPATESSAAEYWGKPFGGWIDTKWQRRLSAADVELIIQTPGLVNLANLLGYELSADIAAWEGMQAPTDRPSGTSGQHE